MTNREAQERIMKYMVAAYAAEETLRAEISAASQCFERLAVMHDIMARHYRNIAKADALNSAKPG